ncbi:protein regulator of cytokinesis 1-like [Venturia canescens]|uniref:protein regulator of cytokinesis 1-like n=1 Tax=Venturia canescens TaxID=32260 RepID=UPI001C9D4398|nr:protein regulator of cytokinesis 1-like [Venturia canescens]
MSDQPAWHSFRQDINNSIDKLFTKLYELWDEIGLNEHTRQANCKQATSHFLDLIKDMIKEVEDRKENLLNSIAMMLESIDVLCTELKCKHEIESYNSLPLMEVQSKLKTQLESLKKKKEQRLQCLKELQEQERHICKALGVQPIGISVGVPSYEELENFKFYLEKQQDEKIRLERIFKDMQHSIINMMDALAYVPNSDFEILVCTNENNFVYSAQNMVKLRELRDYLKESLSTAKEKAASRREELIALWKYLEVPGDSCKNFLDKYSGYSLNDLFALEEEIKLCKQKRSENIAKYVKKVREELKSLWDKCKFGEDQRKRFKPYYIDLYDEDLLTIHDAEVERLREYYNKNKKLFELVNECENLWEKGKELDQRANDPERLHNRGGQLLIEEKERKLIQKKLPKLEEQINILIEHYEAENGEPFTINGMSCDQFFRQSIQDYAEMKETLKKQRQAKAKDKSLKKTPVMSTSRRTPATTTSLLRPAHTSVKRRDDKSPLGNSAKRNRMAQSDKTRPTVCTSKVRRSNRIPRKLIKTLNASNRSTTKQTELMNDTQATIGSVAQYEQFQQHLEQREELRSSLLPEQVLKKARGRPKMRTPVKTPVKPLRKNLSSVSTTPKQTPRSSHIREPSRSPKMTTTPRLAAAPSKLPFFF